jgi:D-alanyl-D-alanine carboxypeptidase
MLIALAALLAATAPTPASPEPVADALAAEVAASSPQHGLSIAVSHGGATFVKGYGLADARGHVAASGGTVYPICSISKNFAAAAILKLAEGGKLDLDAPVARYLAPDPLPGRAVTVRQLLNHTSGAGSYNEGPDWSALAPLPISHEQMLARIAATPHETPGEAWGYSNSAFYVAGLLVEHVTGKSYWGYLDQAFFEPLGMRQARACAAVPSAERARGYRVTKAGLEDAETESWENPFAGGGLCMPAGDLVTWQAALDRGKALAPESVRRMRSPTRLVSGAALDYGLGTRMGALEGHPVLGHTGGGQGFSTVLLRFPEDDLTLVVLTTTSGTEARIIAARLARRLLALPAFTPKDLPVPAALVQALPGQWLGDNGPIRVKAIASRLAAQIGDTGPTLPLAFQGGTSFVVGEENVVRFVVEKSRSDLALEYVGGLFDSATRRVGP